jgi:hypothetical protein
LKNAANFLVSAYKSASYGSMPMIEWRRSGTLPTLDALGFSSGCSCSSVPLSRNAMTFFRKNLGMPFLPPMVNETDFNRFDFASLSTMSLEHRSSFATSSAVRTSIGSVPSVLMDQFPKNESKDFGIGAVNKNLMMLSDPM